MDTTSSASAALRIETQRSRRKRLSPHCNPPESFPAAKISQIRKSKAVIRSRPRHLRLLLFHSCNSCDSWLPFGRGLRPLQALCVLFFVVAAKHVVLVVGNGRKIGGQPLLNSPSALATPKSMTLTTGFVSWTVTRTLEGFRSR